MLSEHYVNSLSFQLSRLPRLWQEGEVENSEPLVAAKRLSAAALADLLELTSRMLHSRGYAADLFPAQWVALRYFARAQRDLRTASELARFQGLANGPVSRTVRTLLQKGLLKKSDDQPKGRAELLELSEAGQELLKLDPMAELTTILGRLAPDDQVALARGLEQVLRGLSGGED